MATCSTSSHSYRPGRAARIAGLVLACSGASPASSAVITVGQPGDPNCDYHILQSAITAAAASPGLDIIRLAIGTYAAQRLSVNDADALAIEGGFVDCANLVRAGHSVLDGQGANPPGPVLSHSGAGALTLSDLQLRNGNASGNGSTAAAGGGVLSSGAGALTVYRSLIHSNRAELGGGMYVGPSTRQFKQVQLSGVSFVSNVASRRGGGLYATQSHVMIGGEAINAFTGNRADGTDIADGGGALYARGSDVTVISRAPGDFAFMQDNSAASNGGAIHFTQLAAGNVDLMLGNTDATRPLVLSGNTAGRFGGALYLRSSADASGSNSARALLLNSVIEANNAPEGSAFYLYASGSGVNTGQAALRMLAGRTDGVAACSQVLRCNRIERNVSGLWATMVLEQGQGGSTDFTLERGQILDNIAPNGGGLIDSFGGGSVGIDNSVIAGNDAGRAPLIYQGGGLLQVSNSTIAANLRLTPAVFAIHAAPGLLQLHNSIVFQPAVAVTALSSGAGAMSRNLMVGDGHGLGNGLANNILAVADPLFVNPGQRDFSLRQGSQAINRWDAAGSDFVPELDLRGARRPAASAGAPTPYDFGAHEFGGVVEGPLLRDGFETRSGEAR